MLIWDLMWCLIWLIMLCDFVMTGLPDLCWYVTWYDAWFAWFTFIRNLLWCLVCLIYSEFVILYDAWFEFAFFMLYSSAAACSTRCRTLASLSSSWVNLSVLWTQVSNGQTLKNCAHHASDTTLLDLVLLHSVPGTEGVKYWLGTWRHLWRKATLVLNSLYEVC